MLCAPTMADALCLWFMKYQKVLGKTSEEENYHV